MGCRELAMTEHTRGVSFILNAHVVEACMCSV